MTSPTPRLPRIPERLSLRRALSDLFWIAIMLPLPIIGVAKVIGAIARL
jgi:hypothetical protein